MLEQHHSSAPQDTNDLPADSTLLLLPLAHSDTFIIRAATILEKNYADEQFNVASLSRRLYLCPMQVHRKIKQRTGLSPGQLLLRFRLSKACSLLHMTELSIGEIAWQTGFASQNYFARAFRKEMGLSPKEARQGGMLGLC